MSWAYRLQLIVLVLFLVACADPGEETAVPTAPPVPTDEPTPEPIEESDNSFIVIATDAPNAPYVQFDEFGEVDGFEASLLQYITDDAQLEYELIVTPV